MDKKMDFDLPENEEDELAMDLIKEGLTTVVGAQILLKKPYYQVEKLVIKGKLRKIKEPFHRRLLYYLQDIARILNLSNDELFELIKKERVPIIGQTNIL